MKRKTIFVGISGGVDSSVSALLLKQQGCKVVGVFIRTWTPDFLVCDWREERRDAMRVCAQLGIPFLECNAEKEYKKNVADYMISEYKAGRTPNPDVMCNREIKFGVFWNFAKKHGADFIATGHYAKSEILNSFRKATGGGVPFRAQARNGVKGLRENLFEMKRGVDNNKDQSYFLWTLTQKDLAHTLFPIGHLNKKQVRKIAEKNNLFTAEKKDSQGICFLGQLDIKEFLTHYIKPKKGNVVDEKGNIIGHHNGAIFFTLGERHGFTITKKSSSDDRYYVIGKDVKKNTITVSHRLRLWESCRCLTSAEYKLINTNWIIDKPKSNKTYQAQIRYHGEYFNCKISCTGQTSAEIKFEPARTAKQGGKNVLVAPGQSVVVYDKNICLGGGVVK